jgi:tripartite-type tricarboxylate transporter receptor subunit TctC
MAAGAAALPAVLRVAWAQAYPTRPVHLIIGFPPGSASDILARIIGQRLTEQIGQPVIIEAKPGASGNIAVQTALAAPADGYTVVQIGASNAINATLFQSLPFDLLRDLVPVAGAVPLLLSSAQFGKLMADDTEKWGKVIRAAHIKVQ